MKKPASWLLDWGLWFTLAIAVITLFQRFYFHNALLAYYEDDFFYYLQIARNMAIHGMSSFDGIHLTNGYHPLWLLTLTILFKIVPGEAFYYVLEGLTAALVLAVYLLSRSCLLRYTSNASYASLVSAAIAFLALGLARGGMEVTLTIPLIMLLISYRLRPSFHWSSSQALTLGFLASLVVLSRLDSGVLIVILFLIDAIIQRFSLKQWLWRGGEYVIGAWPIGLYLLINQRIFGTMIPVSGQAKGIRFHHYPSLIPLKSLFMPRYFTQIVTTFPSILIGVIAAFLLMRRSKNRAEDASLRIIAWALLSFPVTYFVILCFHSDWPLWLWYYYPFVFLVFGGSISLIVCAYNRDQPLSGKFIKGIAVVFVLCVSLYTARSLFTQKTNSLYVLSTDLAGFATHHPGIYAMGDRAGTPGFLIHDPLIQLEGLVMDKKFLSYIRAESDLKNVFEDYKVTYYIATDPTLNDGCYLVMEPAGAGPDVPKMHGAICKKPIAQFVESDKGGTVEEDVFDVHNF
jgi:hypothetical protein